MTGEYPVFGASGFIKNIGVYQQEKDVCGSCQRWSWDWTNYAFTRKIFCN